MYNLPYYKEKEQSVILDFINKNPFAFITGCTSDNKPVATQIPVFIEDRNDKLYLSGHIMKGTDHHKAFENNPAALCIFTGPHTYVSATLYSDPQQASTWNYMSVHVKGILRFLDEQGLLDVLRKTTLHFEKNNTESSTVFDNLPADYTSRLMKAIIAFEVEVKSIEHVFKLSQDRDQTSYRQIIQHLKKGDSNARAIADEMEKREEQLFNKKIK